MFSLITTIISIALAVGVTGATMYYLSGTGDSDAILAAAELLTQSEQIAAAIDMQALQEKSEISRVVDLVTENYLTQVPVPPEKGYSEGKTPSASDWWVVKTEPRPVVVVQAKLKEDVCLVFNEKFSGRAVVRESIDPTLRIQCYGTAEPYSVLINPAADASLANRSVATWNEQVTAGNISPNPLPEDPAHLPKPEDKLPPGAQPLPELIVGGGAVVVYSVNGIPSKAFPKIILGEFLCDAAPVVGKKLDCTATLTNAGQKALTTKEISFSTTNKEFSISLNCGLTIEPSTSCIVTVSSTPNTAGTKSTVIEIAAPNSKNDAKTINYTAVSALKKGMLYGVYYFNTTSGQHDIFSGGFPTIAAACESYVGKIRRNTEVPYRQHVYNEYLGYDSTYCQNTVSDAAGKYPQPTSMKYYSTSGCPANSVSTVDGCECKSGFFEKDGVCLNPDENEYTPLHLWYYVGYPTAWGPPQLTPTMACMDSVGRAYRTSTTFSIVGYNTNSDTWCTVYIAEAGGKNYQGGAGPINEYRHCPVGSNSTRVGNVCLCDKGYENKGGFCNVT